MKNSLIEFYIAIGIIIIFSIGMSFFKNVKISSILRYAFFALIGLMIGMFL